MLSVLTRVCNFTLTRQVWLFPSVVVNRQPSSKKNWKACLHQDSTTRSLHTNCVLEPTLSHIFLFLEALLCMAILKTPVKATVGVASKNKKKMESPAGQWASAFMRWTCVTETYNSIQGRINFILCDYESAIPSLSDMVDGYPWTALYPVLSSLSLKIINYY